MKKAIIIELAGVLDADEEIDPNEETWIKKLGSDWGFRDSEVKKMVRWTQDLTICLEKHLTILIRDKGGSRYGNFRGLCWKGMESSQGRRK